MLPYWENRILLDKMPKKSPWDIGTIGNALTSLFTLGLTNIKNDLFVPDLLDYWI